MAAREKAGGGPPIGSVSLNSFTHVDDVSDIGTYIRALEAFDAQETLQELKALAIAATGTGPRNAVLDVGCGFGLESLRLARRVLPGGSVTGIDKSAAFIAEARRRADAAGLEVDFLEGDAESLPFGDGMFDVSRAERLLIYLEDPSRALAEIHRVTRPGGAIALIEPDFDTNTINVLPRELTRRVLAHECDKGVVQGWLVRDLRWKLEEAGFRDVAIATRVVLFDPDLAAAYFPRLGRNAREAGVVDDAELEHWTSEIGRLHAEGRLFCAIGYFLFTARR